MAENEWLQRAWIAFAIVGIMTAAFSQLQPSIAGLASLGHGLPLMFLLVPVPFYALSVAYGGVPIFIPRWWPFSYYNVRYGLQLLPAFAVALVILVHLALRLEGWSLRLRAACVLGVFRW